MRRTKSSTSAASKALSRLSMGTPCSTGAKLSDGAAPTRRDGESPRTSSGNRASMAALRRFRAS